MGELSSFKQALLPIVGAFRRYDDSACSYLLYDEPRYRLCRRRCYTNGNRYCVLARCACDAWQASAIVAQDIHLPLAVVDDIGGIIVIAAFYSTHIELMMLVYALVLFGVLLLGSAFAYKEQDLLSRHRRYNMVLFLNSGIHPTIAGVLVAFCVCLQRRCLPLMKYIKIIRNSIAHFSVDEPEDLVKRSILDKEQMNWLKQVESASDKVISPLQVLEDSLHPIDHLFYHTLVCVCKCRYIPARYGSCKRFSKASRLR